MGFNSGFKGLTRLSPNIVGVSKNISCVQEVMGSKTVAKLRENIITIERRYMLGLEYRM